MMIVEYTVNVEIGWKGDSQNGWPVFRQDKVRGLAVGFVQRYENGASVVVQVGSKLDVVDISEVTIVKGEVAVIDSLTELGEVDEETRRTNAVGP